MTATPSKDPHARCTQLSHSKLPELQKLEDKNQLLFIAAMIGDTFSCSNRKHTAAIFFFTLEKNKHKMPILAYIQSHYLSASLVGIGKTPSLQVLQLLLDP